MVTYKIVQKLFWNDPRTTFLLIFNIFYNLNKKCCCVQGTKEYSCTVCEYKTHNHSTFQAIWSCFNYIQLITLDNYLFMKSDQVLFKKKKMFFFEVYMVIILSWKFAHLNNLTSSWTKHCSFFYLSFY